MDVYVDYLVREAEMLAELPWVQAQHYHSIYIGGGTPTLLKAEGLEKILRCLCDRFPLVESREICVEVRPGNEADQDKLNRLRACGVTRISMGAQSLNQEVLNRNGRVHTIDIFYEIYNRVRRAGIDFVNVDLMTGLPFDTPETWSETLDRILALAPEHITCYKTHTYRGSALEEQTLNLQDGLVSEEEELAMFQTFVDRVQAAGYTSNEISYTFSKTSDHIHQYRLHVNSGNQCLAMGVSGNGFMNRSVYQNIGNIKEYQEAVAADRLPIKRAYRMDHATMMKRALIYCLRRGIIDRDHFEQRFGRDPWDVMQQDFPSLVEDDLLTEDDEQVRLRYEAMPFADHIVRTYLLTEREQKMEQLLANHKNLHVLPQATAALPARQPSKNKKKKVDLRDPRR